MDLAQPQLDHNQQDLGIVIQLTILPASSSLLRLQGGIHITRQFAKHGDMHHFQKTFGYWAGLRCRIIILSVYYVRPYSEGYLLTEKLQFAILERKRLQMTGQNQTQRRKYPDEWEHEYEDQLRQWINKSGKNHKELASLAENINIRRRKSSRISDSTFTRIIQSTPSSRNKAYNLCAILGALYTLGTIDKSEIENFLFVPEYRIPISEEEWLIIWQDITKSVEAIQQGTPLIKVPNRKLTIMKLSQWRYWLGIFAFIGVISVIFLIVLLKNNEIPSYSSCGKSITSTESVFLPDQGFSLYQASPELPESNILSNNVRSVGIDKQGLWVGYIPSGNNTDRVSFYDKTNWTHFCTGVHLATGQNVNEFAFYEDHVLIATDGGGVGIFDGTNWRFYTQSDGLLSNSIYSLETIDDSIYAATYEGVSEFDGDKWEIAYQAQPGTLASNHVYNLLKDSQNNYWFGFIERGISELTHEGNWFSYFTNDPNLQNIRGIVEDNEGGIWFATDNGGVLRFYDDTWTIFNVASHQLPSDKVRDIELDKYGRIWIATDQGVAFTPDSGMTWLTHSSIDTLDITFGCRDCAYDDNHIWLVLNDVGIGHVRIPPLSSPTEFISIPTMVRLHPGESYVFQVEVRAVADSLTPIDGDSLRSIEPVNSFLFGAYPIIPVTHEVSTGDTYVFTNIDNPIVAPNTPGVYQLKWRLWQGRRFVSDPITIVFEVISE